MINKKEVIKYFVAVLALIGIFASGFCLGKYFQNYYCEKNFAQKLERYSQVDLSLFWKVWDILHENYLEKDKLDPQKLLYGAISGLIQATGDPYSSFLTPEETKKFEEEMKGEYQGVGLVIGQRKGQIVVISPLEDTPAKKANILPGDIILKINNKETTSMSLEEAATLIRGPKGTEVTLTIIREGWNEPKDITLTRETVKIPNLKLKFLPDDIALIEIYQFNESLSKDFRLAVNQILNSPTKRIILDLRNNPGGYLDVAEEVAGYFLKKNDIILIEDYGAKKEKEIHKSKGKGELLNYPLVILINQGTASGAEILAGCLRDNRGVKLVGEKTFGKGSVQETIGLDDGSLLKITIAKWLLPKGQSISENGLDPDIKVEMTEEDYKNNKDKQLEKAIEIIKNL
jgi:carboxyl-terminal processing protease